MLLNLLNIYEGLILIINGVKINSTRGLPQGSALSPIFFSLYINNVLEELNKEENIHIQAYADDIIILSNNISNIQNAYDKSKELFHYIELEINPNKCELISNDQNDKIIDKDNSSNLTEINAKGQAKYLGQIINEKGIPTNNIKRIDFGNLTNIIIRNGELTKTAKLKIFQIYVKSKINHLIPMITLTGGINDLWKTIRKFIFNHLLEYNTMPIESASAFNLGFYEIIIKPIKKLIKRNLDFTGNEDLNNMLNDCLMNVLKQWLIVEPKHTDKVKKMIIDNIEKKKYLI